MRPDYVTILVPCYNHTKYLEGVIANIAEQTYPYIKTVIINDGGTDGFETWAAAHPHINTISYKENKKQAFARNEGIKATIDNTAFYMQLDADDKIIDRDKVKKCVKILQENPDIGLVYTDVIINYYGVYIKEYRHSYDRQLLEIINTISNSPVFRASLLYKVGLYDIDLPPCEDWDMWLRLTEHSLAYHLPIFAHQYNVVNSSCTNTVSQEIWQQKRSLVLAKMKARYEHNKN